MVTKGRIISQEGVTSPEIDVLVLRGTYPQKLINKKLYLAAGVAAAFECKITLRASHIEEAVETCAKVKNLYPVRVGTPYKELHSPIIYGLLAHSHSWKEENSTPEGNVERRLREADRLRVSHPRLQLDLLCVADLATWAMAKHAAVPQQQIPGTEVMYHSLQLVLSFPGCQLSSLGKSRLCVTYRNRDGRSWAVVYRNRLPKWEDLPSIR